MSLSSFTTFIAYVKCGYYHVDIVPPILWLRSNLKRVNICQNVHGHAQGCIIYVSAKMQKDLHGWTWSCREVMLTHVGLYISEYQQGKKHRVKLIECIQTKHTTMNSEATTNLQYDTYLWPIHTPAYKIIQQPITVCHAASITVHQGWNQCTYCNNTPAATTWVTSS